MSRSEMMDRFRVQILHEINRAANDLDREIKNGMLRHPE